MDMMVRADVKRRRGASRRGAKSTVRVLPPFLLLSLLVLSPPGAQSLAAQDPEPSPSRMLLAVGLAGSPGSAHRFAGGQFALGGERFGILAHGAYGSGNQFTSFLLGAGPSARLALLPSKTGIPVELRVFGGWGRYGESLAEESHRSGAGESRGAWGPQGGATLLVPMGPLRAGLGVMAWGGRFQAEPMLKGVPARGSRLVLLLGR